MHNKKQRYAHEDLKSLIMWWEKDITPQSIFGLENYNKKEKNWQQLWGFKKICPYTVDTVQQVYKQLKIQSHPDRYRSETPNYQQDAEKVSQLIEEARDYLLFTINEKNPITDANVFYAYYYLDWSPNASLEGKFENFVKRIYALKEKKQVATEQVLAIQALIQQQPDLIHHTKTKGNFSYQLFEKNIVYCAAQWNEAGLMDWLLTDYSSEIDILTNTEFGVSPFGVAVLNVHVDVLLILQKHYGDDWLKSQLDKCIGSKDIVDFVPVLRCYEALFPDSISTFMENLLLLPALIQIGRITDDPGSAKLRRAIIGCPQLYRSLDEEMRKDPYMIVAFLIQQPEEDWLKSIPLRKLDPKFAIALADRWPALSDDLSLALHRDAPPYPNYCNYAMFQYACIGLVVGICLILLLWHVWPMVALWPEPVKLLVGLTAPLLPLLVFGSAIGIASYAISIYPEARKINTILRDNSFFPPAPGSAAPDQSVTPTPLGTP